MMKLRDFQMLMPRQQQVGWVLIKTVYFLLGALTVLTTILLVKVIG